MRIGASLFLIALGAILKWAVTAHVTGLSLPIIGVILMIVGGVGLLFELVVIANHRRTVVRTPGTAYLDPGDDAY